MANELIPLGMCETADWGGVILGQSIDKTSCRGQRFSHLYSHYDGKTCREPWWQYKTQRKPAQITTKTRLHLTKTANLFPHEFPICYNLLSQVITEETIVYTTGHVHVTCLFLDFTMGSGGDSGGVTGDKIKSLGLCRWEETSKNSIHVCGNKPRYFMMQSWAIPQ